MTQSVQIDIPSDQKHVPLTKFTVPGLLYQKITSVIEAAFHDPLAHHLHLSPFKLFHHSPTTRKEEHVMGEVYTLDAFLEEHDCVQWHSPVPLDDPNCKREKVVAAVMFSSDGTHLTNFGMAKAWPLYFMLRNLSKYLQSLPNTGAMHHLAYIPSLLDSFQDVASKFHDKWKTQQKAITTHCRYQQTPTFGRDTIRRFANNVSEMKKLAAQDFEDLLQKNALEQIAKQVDQHEALQFDQSANAAAEHEEIANALLDKHHIMSNLCKKPLNMYAFVTEQHNGQLDPAKKGSIPKLQEHLLARLLGREFNGDDHEDFTDEDRNNIHIIDNKMYSVQLFHVNYITYDIRRASDTINPCTHCHVMVCSPETGPNVHPFWYAQVLGIFHVRVLHRGPHSVNPNEQHNMEFLWVRWLGLEPGHHSGCQFVKLPKVRFVPDSDPYAFGFLNPSDVIRGAHIIPAFAAGKTSELLTANHTAAWPSSSRKDWVNFYIDINSFVDRDMYFCYIGYGIGHITPTAFLENAPEDEDPNHNLEDDDEMDLDAPPTGVHGSHNKGHDGEDDEGGDDNKENGDDDNDDDDDDQFEEDNDTEFDEDDDDPNVGYGGL
ncbi:hypothetical protein H0H81_012056 [Sphagnurus paluster]|uniref:Uncharacterized protein n=1 Tax=Sphagnurus paluster TaxID=117069 RepID=A0A9P7K4U7_9AGAR|nr:hypothetical protein H0H81_012056 [Sphagnurus paluster]